MVIILIVVGVLLGAKVEDIEFLRPKAAESEAQQSAEELRHQKALHRLEEDKRKAEIELEQEKESRQAAIEEQTAVRVAEAKVFGLYALIVAGTGLLLFVGLALCYLLVRRLDTLNPQVADQSLSTHSRTGGSHPEMGESEFIPANLRPMSDQSHSTFEGAEEAHEKVLEFF
jgi:hypothetical protein